MASLYRLKPATAGDFLTQVPFCWSSSGLDLVRSTSPNTCSLFLKIRTNRENGQCSQSASRSNQCLLMSSSWSRRWRRWIQTNLRVDNTFTTAWLRRRPTTPTSRWETTKVASTCEMKAEANRLNSKKSCFHVIPLPLMSLIWHIQSSITETLKTNCFWWQTNRFPHRESNPGRLGENQESWPLDHMGRWLRAAAGGYTKLIVAFTQSKKGF